MRSQANDSAAEVAPKLLINPVLKGSLARKAAVPEAVGRAERKPAGSWTVAGTKRIAQ